MSTSLRSLALLPPALLALACGGPTPDEQGKKPPARTGSRYDKAPVAADSAPAAEAGADAAAADAAFEEEEEGGGDDWESADDEAGEAAADGDTDDAGAEDEGEDEAADAGADGAEAGEDAGEAATPHAGPCKVTWTSGTVVRFEYDDDEKGGKAKVDADGDGKSDVCASFKLKDGRTSKVSVQQDCKGKADFAITPKYAADTNVATAKFEDTATKEKRDITLVALPSFSGVAPGYPLHAPKKKIKMTNRDGLVRTAKVTEPSEGPPTDVKFFYDDKGRIKTIKEDLGIDGTTDQKYTYRYDAAGNVTRVTLSVTQPDGTAKKTTARLDYSCWE